MVPSLDEVMEYQSFALPGEAVFSVHVAPESVEVQMFSALTTAASLVPSLDEVMEYHFLMLPTEISSVHVPPEFVEVQMLPFRTTAASLVPSLDEVIDHQFFALPGEAVFSVHVKACAGPHAHNKRSTINRRRHVLDPRRRRATTFIFGGVPLPTKGGVE